LDLTIGEAKLLREEFDRQIFEYERMEDTLKESIGMDKENSK